MSNVSFIVIHFADKVRGDVGLDGDPLLSCTHDSDDEWNLSAASRAREHRQCFMAQAMEKAVLHFVTHYCKQENRSRKFIKCWMLTG